MWVVFLQNSSKNSTSRNRHCESKVVVRKKAQGLKLLLIQSQGDLWIKDLSLHNREFKLFGRAFQHSQYGE
ncbi:hypothetical protein AMR76_12895 [Vibrio furnissii]|uniref:Uncharacterized protein n=1 Tax=Vibrio furnissii TaxID=29494 RepID=A0A0Q2N0S0_VIBFU|nr:hypothetical protein AMR76_12895 [Vibrio furnissii]